MMRERFLGVSLAMALILVWTAGPTAANDGSPQRGAEQVWNVSYDASLPALPPGWHVTASALADVTGDDVPEWVLLVWRPWRDWPIQRWSAAPSPIAGFHDAAGESCHLILLDPGVGRETWAGSALPAPFLALAVEDVDGDGENEVVTLEGTYAGGRDGPGTHVDVWGWNGFGFTLAWRSPPGTFDPHCLADADRCGISDMLADPLRARRFE